MKIPQVPKEHTNKNGKTNKQTNVSITGRNKLEFFLTLYIKNNSKWIIIAKIIKFLEENTGINLCDPGLDGGFLEMT